MPLPEFSDKQIDQLAGFVARYIADQRNAFLKKAQPIESAQQERLREFFPADVLSTVRVVRGRASEPSFYPMLRMMGINNAPAFSEMAGITFQDVVVHVEPLTEQLLFHELVHAVQYKHLGLEGFARLYVRGFLTGGSYEEIPLEKQAYELEARFAANPKSHFSVDLDVKKRMAAHTL
jgi:hypothetical protein